MENLEIRVQRLEKKYNFLKNSVLFLMCFAAFAGVTGIATLNLPVFAQQKTEKEGENAELKKLKEEAGIPSVVEAEVFLLKDGKGVIRGIWTADAENTSFAMMHKNKTPIIAMAVDDKNASMSLTDVNSGKISLGLTDSIRALSIMSDNKRSNIYLGLTSTGEAAFDMVSPGNAAVTIDGATSSLDMSGDSAVLALTETVGSTAALKALPSSAGLVFMDYQNEKTFEATTVDGQTSIFMKSPMAKEEKVLDTKKEEILSLGLPAVKDDDASEESATATPNTNAEPAAEEKKAPAKSDDKIVNMKTYSPFAK